MKPRIWAREVFKTQDTIDYLNKHHGTNVNDWECVLGPIDNWGDRNADHEYMYQLYVNWYNRTFSKLGQALQ